MEKSLRTISKVSFFFFLAFGILQIGATMLVMQGAKENLIMLILKTLDLPFLFAGLTYGSSRLSLHIGNITGNSKKPAYLCAGLAGVLFILALYINFMLPDATIQ